MKKPSGRWRWAIAALAVAGYFFFSQRAIPLTEQEKQHVSELTQNLKTHCVGRYLIDMPADMLVSGDAAVDGVEIEASLMSHETYLQEIKMRQTELRRTKSLIDQYPFLYEDDDINGTDAHYFISRGNPGNGAMSRVIEAYKWDRGYRFELSIKASDYLHPDMTNEPSIQQRAVKNDVPQKKQLVFDMIRRLHGRSEDEIPTEPGLCFFGGFLSGKAGDEENAGTQFVLPSNRDVSIGLGSNSGIREPNTLLQRGRQIEGALRETNGGRTIRKGTVALQGLKAEEWLAVGETPSDVIGVTLTLEANSMISSAQTPLVTLHLSTGSTNAYMQDEIHAASLSEGEAVALWDVVSRTLRPRPNGF